MIKGKEKQVDEWEKEIEVNKWKKKVKEDGKEKGKRWWKGGKVKLGNQEIEERSERERDIEEDRRERNKRKWKRKS